MFGGVTSEKLKFFDLAIILPVRQNLDRQVNPNRRQSSVPSLKGNDITPIYSQES